jgi:hypothetical protein
VQCLLKSQFIAIELASVLCIPKANADLETMFAQSDSPPVPVLNTPPSPHSG